MTEKNDNNRQLFSILIPTWNNLEFLKVCVDSIRKNSTYSHQIIIHVNDGSDGTRQWVAEQGLDYTATDGNVGVCLAMNMMRSKVKTDYILFINDDMYALTGWDAALYDEIKRQPDNRFFLSATTIQPHTPNKAVINADYGDTIQTFREADLLREYMSYEAPDWLGSTLPPNIVHRDIWDLVGGYSVELSPGMYSDPDFTAKLWLCGIRRMKGVSASRVYHFETKSTTRIRKNMGQMQFLLKWGMTNGTFRRLFTHNGSPYSETLAAAMPTKAKLRGELIRCRMKALYWLMTKDFGPAWKAWEKF